MNWVTADGENGNLHILAIERLKEDCGKCRDVGER
jgi:hypothetical protein